MLSFADLAQRPSESDAAAAGGGSAANRFGARASRGCLRAAPPMRSMGQRGRGRFGEPGALRALGANAAMLASLANEGQPPGIAKRHAIAQRALPSGGPGAGARALAHANNYSAKEHFASEPDPNDALLISAPGAANSKLTAVAMLEGFRD